MSKRKIDKPKCTVIYQGKGADLDDKAAVTALITPMFQEILGGKTPMKPEITVGGKTFTAMPFGEGGSMNTVKKNLLYQFTEAELKNIGKEMAFTVGELEGVEQEKKGAMAGFKFSAIAEQRLQYKLATFMFLPEEIESLDELLKETALAFSGDVVYLANLSTYDAFFDLVVKIKKKCVIKNSAAAFLKLMELAQIGLDQFLKTQEPEGGPEDELA